MPQISRGIKNIKVNIIIPEESKARRTRFNNKIEIVVKEL
jgi:hypothetical protein